MRLLFTVTETFSVQGRGVVLLPGLRLVDEQKIEVGDPLILKLPDGAEDTVCISGPELLKPLNGKCQLVVMLSEKSKDNVPIGTEVRSAKKS